MAVPSYSTDLVLITDAETITGFSEPAFSTAGGTPVLENDYFIQGSFCVSKSFNTTGVGGIGYTSPSIFSIPTDGAVYTWIYFAAPNAIKTKALGGMQILIGSSRTAYKRFYVSGRDTYTLGGWVNYPVNPNKTASATVGSPTTAWRYTGYAASGSNAISRGNPLAVDVMRYGRGTLQITNGEIGNYGTFIGAAAINDLAANRWGIFSLVDSIYKMQGHILFGTATTPTNFRDSNRIIFIQNTEFVTPAFNLFEVRNVNSTVSLTDISVNSLSTVARGNFIVTDNASVTLDKCSFTDMGTFSFRSNTTVSNTVFRRCQTITHGGAIINQSQILTSPSTTALITSDPSSITDTEFVSVAGSGHAITIDAPGTFSLVGIIFTGYGLDGTTNSAIFNNSGGFIQLNVLGGGSVPTIRNGAGATTTVVVSALVTLNGLKANSEVRAYTGTDPTTAIEIAGVENSGTSFSFSQSVAGQTGYIHIINVDYQPILLPITYGTSDISIPIQQIIDRQYSRGSIFTPA